MLTQEKANQITEFLAKDMDATKVMLDMEPTEVLAKIKAAGIECELDELVEYGNALNSAVEMSQKSELDESSLENVAGGVVITTGLVLGLAGCLAAGAAVGGTAVYVTYKAVKKGW